MKRRAAISLHDILHAIDAVAGMIAHVDLGRYRSDLKLKWAVERAVEIVSEASRHIPESERARFPDMPWAEIASVGNKLRHEYRRVDDAIMWKIAVQSLPQLRPVILALLRSAER